MSGAKKLTESEFWSWCARMERAVKRIEKKLDMIEIREEDEDQDEEDEEDDESDESPSLMNGVADALLDQLTKGRRKGRR